MKGDDDFLKSLEVGQLVVRRTMKSELINLLVQYAIADAEDGGEDYADYASRLRDTVGVGQMNEIFNTVADRMVAIQAEAE